VRVLGRIAHACPLDIAARDLGPLAFVLKRKPEFKGPLTRRIAMQRIRCILPFPFRS
jgi:hypothetical protein